MQRGKKYRILTFKTKYYFCIILKPNKFGLDSLLCPNKGKGLQIPH